MYASVQKTLPQSRDFFPGFAPNSPEQKLLETVQAPRQGGLTGALIPPQLAPGSCLSHHLSHHVSRTPLPRRKSTHQSQQPPTPSCTIGSPKSKPQRQRYQQQRLPPPLHQKNSLRPKLQQAPPDKRHLNFQPTALQYPCWAQTDNIRAGN